MRKFQQGEDTSSKNNEGKLGNTSCLNSWKMEIILVQCCVRSDSHVQVTAGVKAMRQRPYVVSTMLSRLIEKAERSMEM